MEEILEKLRASDEETVKKALFEILEGEVKVPISSLSDVLNRFESGVIKLLAINALEKLDSEEGAKALLDFILSSPPSFHRQAAQSSFAKLCKKFPKLVLHGLRNSEKDIDLFSYFTELAGNIKLREAIPIILQKWNLKDQNISMAIINALGEIGGSEAIPYLIDALRSGDEWIASAAANALGKINHPSAIDTLIEILRDPECPKTVCFFTIEALGELRASKATSDLVRFFRRSEDLTLKSTALRALIKIGESAVEKLIPYLKNRDSNVRILTATVLGYIKDPFALPYLSELLNDPHVNVRYAVVEAIARIDGEDAFPLLLEALNDEDDTVAAVALDGLSHYPKKAIDSLNIIVKRATKSYLRKTFLIELLSKIKNDRAIEELKKLCEDEEVRDLAKEALEEVKP